LISDIILLLYHTKITHSNNDFITNNRNFELVHFIAKKKKAADLFAVIPLNLKNV